MICELVKKDISFFDVLRILKNYGNVYYHGIKDKNAYTSQLICFEDYDFEGILNLRSEKFLLKNFRFSDKKPKRKNLRGNYFKINYYSEEEIDFDEKVEEVNEKGFPNFYGPQRFGYKNNLYVSINYLRGDYEKAAYYLIPENLRKYFWNWDKIYENLKYEHWIEKIFVDKLRKDKDFEEAFNSIPKYVLNIIIKSFASYVFNLTLSKLIEYGEKIPKKLPVIGRKMKVKDEKIKEIIKEILDREGISINDLPFKSYYRISFVYPENLKIYNNTIEFFLIKGAYATVLLKYLILED